MYANKVAFITALNFPSFSLAQKNEFGREWSREQWAYARMGDIFTNRVPAWVNQESNSAYSNGENYIASYNIMMGHLLSESGEKLFPEDMVLLSHWNLRDEIKSNYADVPNAFEKQQMIYKVMEHIACQTIPEGVINNPEYDWAPYANKVYKDGKEVSLSAEGARRYQMILDIYKAGLNLDKFNTDLNTGIKRNFEGDVEISDKDVEEMFINLITSDEIRQVAQIIKERLGRDLQPYDIWYDGFKSRSTISEDELTAKTRKLYPDAKAFEKDMPNMLLIDTNAVIGKRDGVERRILIHQTNKDITTTRVCYSIVCEILEYRHKECRITLNDQTIRKFYVYSHTFIIRKQRHLRCYLVDYGS
jgi:hypothetical protein